MYLLILVLDDVSKLSDVLRAWHNAGVEGVTILDSTGLNRVLKRHHPRAAYARFSQIAGTIYASHNTLFAVIDDLAVADAVAAATQKVTGNLNGPNTGIMFALPIVRVWGASPPEEKGTFPT